MRFGVKHIVGPKIRIVDVFCRGSNSVIRVEVGKEISREVLELFANSYDIQYADDPYIVKRIACPTYPKDVFNIFVGNFYGEICLYVSDRYINFIEVVPNNKDMED